jgi:hypothetical protein
MRLPKDEYAYLCHAHRLVHALGRGLLVGGHSGFYMGNLVHREDAKVRKTKLGHYQNSPQLTTKAEDWFYPQPTGPSSAIDFALSENTPPVRVQAVLLNTNSPTKTILTTAPLRRTCSKLPLSEQDNPKHEWESSP